MFVPFTFTLDIAPIDYGLFAPLRQHGVEDAAFDLRAKNEVRLWPCDHHLVGTGVRVAIPEGYIGLVTMRSGLANKELVTMPNAPGIIDPGYRGEIKVGLYRHLVNADLEMIAVEGGDTRPPLKIKRGERIAQLLVVKNEAEPVLGYFRNDSFDLNYDNTERGEGGFGSTGR